MAALAVLASLPALVENGDNLPLDSHEALVARTAEEMLQRGDWLVPYFNGETRLKKPPLAYWAVMAVDRITTLAGGTGRDISDWEARVPSIFAGIVLVLATAMLGRMLVSRRIGWLAGLLTASSSGYVSFTHSARPEMLYAALCTAGLACFAKSWSRVRNGGAADGVPRWVCLAGWLLMGLATLTKGPQLPLLMMVGWVIGLWACGYRGRVALAVRPVSGMIAAMGVAAWWYAAIAMTVPGVLNRWKIETVDRALIADSLLEWIEPYYFYRTAALMVPWMLAFPFVLALPWLRKRPLTPGPRLLWWVLATSMIGLSIPAGRRWYYMLPVMAPLIILTAQVAMRFGRSCIIDKRVLWQMLLVAHCVGCAAAAVLMTTGASGNIDTQQLMAIITLAVGIGTAVHLWRCGVERKDSAGFTAALCALVSLTLFTTMAEAELLWRRKRFDEAEFARSIQRHVPSDQPLALWESNWEAGTYYLGRVTPVIRTPQKLEAELQRSSGDGLWLVTQGDVVPPPFVESRLEMELRDDSEVKVRLWMVDSAPSSALMSIN